MRPPSGTRAWRAATSGFWYTAHFADIRTNSLAASDTLPELGLAPEGSALTAALPIACPALLVYSGDRLKVFQQFSSHK